MYLCLNFITYTIVTNSKRLLVLIAVSSSQSVGRFVCMHGTYDTTAVPLQQCCCNVLVRNTRSSTNPSRSQILLPTVLFILLILCAHNIIQYRQRKGSSNRRESSQYAFCVLHNMNTTSILMRKATASSTRSAFTCT